MDVFISWSGKLGKAIADELRTWLPTVIQAVKPFYSPDDIAKGKNWNAELNQRLKASRIGIIIVTPECREAPWLLYEAGAISSNFDEAHVCPVLFGMHPADIVGPLVQFQVTPFERAEFRKLVGAINSALGESRLENEVLDRVFETFWPRLNEAIEKIIKSHVPTKDTSPSRTDRELLEELLRLTRQLSQRSKISSRTEKLADSAQGELVTFDSTHQTICVQTDANSHTYDIELARLDSGAEIVDFIFQIAAKGWSGPDHVYQFVRMIEDLSQAAFGVNAQGLFCPSGVNKTVPWPSDVQL